MNKITKAVFPVAGLGTRFLPATKSIPKEMLPIADKPLIQYVVNEAIAAGIRELIFVTNDSKAAIKNYFAPAPQLEQKLQNKPEALNAIENILPKNISCAYIEQQEPLGLGHAVLCAKKIVGDEPFAVLLPDDLIYNEVRGCLQQMLDVFQQNNSSVIAVQQIKPEDCKKYGVIDVNDKPNLVTKIRGIIEKPKLHDAPSNFGVVGRYLLTPAIFDLLERVTFGGGGEIQLTDGIAALIQHEDVYAYKFMGTRYDCGTKAGFLRGTVEYALRHQELADEFKKLLRKMEEKS